MEREANYAAVGAFVLVVALVAALFVYWYSGTRVHRKYDHYEIYFNGSVSGLEQGAAVRYLGVRVGRVVEMRIDCDQDAVWIRVEQEGAGACHTGRRSCFYRAVPLGESGAVRLEFRDGEKTFDPDAVYGKK